MALATHLYQALNAAYGRKDLPTIKAGETVRVHQTVKEGKKERIQIFEGVVIAVKHGAGLNGTFTVRRVASGGVAVEKVYPLHLPSIVQIDQVKKAKVRRAKLYYLRGRQGKATRFATEWMTNKSWQEAQAEELGGAEATETAAEPAEAPAEVVEAPAESEAVAGSEAVAEPATESDVEVKDAPAEEVAETPAEEPVLEVDAEETPAADEEAIEEAPAEPDAAPEEPTAKTE